MEDENGREKNIVTSRSKEKTKTYRQNIGKRH